MNQRLYWRLKRVCRRRQRGSKKRRQATIQTTLCNDELTDAAVQPNYAIRSTILPPRDTMLILPSSDHRGTRRPLPTSTTESISPSRNHHHWHRSSHSLSINHRWIIPSFSLEHCKLSLSLTFRSLCPSSVWMKFSVTHFSEERSKCTNLIVVE